VLGTSSGGSERLSVTTRGRALQVKELDHLLWGSHGEKLEGRGTHHAPCSYCLM
jgi:hypothetical protein